MIFDTLPKNPNKSWKIILDDENAIYREWLQKLWGNFKPYAPNDFKYHIENDEEKLDSLIWEMLLANTLLEAGFTLKKVSSDNPDICINYNGGNIWIECTVPNTGDPTRPDSVPEKKFDGEFHEVPMDKNTLRFTNALSEKKKQYSTWLERGVCKREEPFIIALHGRKLDFKVYERRLPDILRALYAVGDMVVTFNTKSDFHDEGYSRKPEIKKVNDSVVSTTFFCDNNNVEISGVLFSREWCQYLSLSPKYCFVKNIFATNPSPISFNSFAQEYEYGENSISLKT